MSLRLKNVYSESDESHKSLKHAFENNHELNI